LAAVSRRAAEAVASGQPRRGGQPGPVASRRPSRAKPGGGRGSDVGVASRGAAMSVVRGGGGPRPVV
jgi:hypothetical protein